MVFVTHTPREEIQGLVSRYATLLYNTFPGKKKETVFNCRCRMSRVIIAPDRDYRTVYKLADIRFVITG